MLAGRPVAALIVWEGGPERRKNGVTAGGAGGAAEWMQGPGGSGFVRFVAILVLLALAGLVGLFVYGQMMEPETREIEMEATYDAH